MSITPPIIAQGVEPTAASCAMHRINRYGKSKPLAGAAKARRQEITNEIVGAFQRRYQRPMLAEDVNPEVAEDLIAKWREGVMPGVHVRTRLTWFKTTNSTAARLGFADLHDFSGVRLAGPVPESIDASIESLSRYRIGSEGGLELPKIQPRQRKDMRKEIQGIFETEFGRPMAVSDLNPAVAERIAERCRESGVGIEALKRRIRWFNSINAVAAKLSLCDRHDFSLIDMRRRRKVQRKRVDGPEDVPPPPADLPSPESDDWMTLHDFFENDYRPTRLTGKSLHTVRLYRGTIVKFGRWLGRQAVIGDLNRDTVTRFLNWHVDHSGHSLHSIEKYRCELVAIWNLASRRGLLNEYPDIRKIIAPSRSPDAWTDSELAELLKACESAPGKVGKVPASAFWSALVSTIYDTGERISALLEVRPDDLSRNGWLTVLGEHRKGKTRDRSYKLRPSTIERVKAIKVTDQTRLFEWPHCTTYIWNRFGKVLENAGLPNNRRTKFHKIRRTVASNFEAAGGNATRLLDHRDRRTTEAYLDPRVLKEVQPADVLPAIGETIEKAAEAGEVSGDVLEQIRALLAKGGESRPPAPR